MRERVDKFGVAEPEIQRTGETRSTSRCRTSRTPTRPPTRSARRRRCSSTTGSPTSSGRAASRPTRRTSRSPEATAITGGQSGRVGERSADAVRRGPARVELPGDEHRQGDPRRAVYYLVDTEKASRSSRAPRRRAPTSMRRSRTRRSSRPATRRSSRSSPGRSSIEAETGAGRGQREPTPTSCCATSRRSAARTSRTRSRTSTGPGGSGRAERHLRASPTTGARAGRTTTREIAQRGSENNFGGDPQAGLPALRDRAGQRDHQRAVHRLQPEPRRHRRRDRLARSRAASRSTRRRTSPTCSRPARCRSSSS